MTKTTSLPETIEGLQRSAAFHQEREAFHAQQQAHHAEQEKLHGEERARHAAELETVSRQLEELREIAERLDQAVQKVRVAPPEPKKEEPKEEALGPNAKLSHALDRVLESWPPEAPFTATSIAAEVLRRYGALLRRSVDTRVIASALRRRRRDGLVREVRGGRPHLEAEYRKVK